MNAIQMERRIGELVMRDSWFGQLGSPAGNDELPAQSSKAGACLLQSMRQTTLSSTA
jgi:hypothetical protein